MRLLFLALLPGLIISLNGCSLLGAGDAPGQQFVGEVRATLPTPQRMFDAPPIPGAGGRLEPLPQQDWRAFPWVEAARTRPPAPQAGDPEASDSTIIVYGVREGQVVEVARYSQAAGVRGNLPIDPRALLDGEAKVVITRGVLVAGVNRSSVEYVLGLKDRLQQVQHPVIWALIGPDGVVLEWGTHHPTAQEFCGALRTGTACLWFDGQMQVIQVDMLS